jgi:hypothetical protein
MKDDEVITYLVAGLPAEYDSFVTSMTTKSTPLTLDDVFTYLMAYEVCQLQHQSELQHQLRPQRTMLDVVVVVTADTAMSLVVGGVLPLLGVVRLLVLSKIVVAPPLVPLPDMWQGRAQGHSVLVPDG